MKINLRNASLSMLAIAAATLMAGCNLTQTLPMPVDGTALHGRVMGGQQPVSGSTIALYAAGNTGYGSAYPYSSGTSLLGTNTVTTDGNGFWNITNDYTCPSASTEVYIVSAGGNSGSGNNSNVAVMAALGPCGNLSSATSITINELTTVASVWALAPFMTGVANIGTSSTNATGLTNAFATVNKLANVSTGVIPGPSLPSGATAPTNKINTIADILAACINSPGGVHGDTSACGTLFANTSVGGIFPTDTITAAMNMAQNPTANVSTLVGLATPTSPFQPTLGSTPNDLALVVTHTGGGLLTPRDVSIDASGNVWTANSGSVSKFSNIGAPISGSGGYTPAPIANPIALAVDSSGNAWVANQVGNSVVKMNSIGTTGSTYSVPSTPASLAVDTSGNAWVLNGTTLTEIFSVAGQSNFTGGSLGATKSVAINPK